MKKYFITIMILILVIFTGCSPVPSEREANEEKLRKVAGNMGVSEEEIEKNLKNMTDEELAQATSFINEDGQIDTSKIFAEVGKEQEKENSELIKNAKLKEISISCSYNEDEKHLRDGFKLSLEATGVTDEGKEVSLNNLNGKLKIDIYNIVEDKNSDSFFIEYKKKDLIKTISGDIDDLMEFEKTSGLLGVFHNYNLVVDSSDLDKNKLLFKKNYYDNDYEYNYLIYPLWLDITYSQDDKEFREVLSPNDFSSCDVYNFVETIDPNEPNNEIALKNKYLEENIILKNIKVEKDYNPYDWQREEKDTYFLTGTIENNGDENIYRLGINVNYLNNEIEISTEEYAVISIMTESLKSNSKKEFKHQIHSDVPEKWDETFEFELGDVTFE